MVVLGKADRTSGRALSSITKILELFVITLPRKFPVLNCHPEERSDEGSAVRCDHRKLQIPRSARDDSSLKHQPLITSRCFSVGVGPRNHRIPQHSNLL